ncbi:hypothetical protein ACFL5N_00810 [bacterium]
MIKKVCLTMLVFVMCFNIVGSACVDYRSGINLTRNILMLESGKFSIRQVLEMLAERRYDLSNDKEFLRHLVKHRIKYCMKNWSKKWGIEYEKYLQQYVKNESPSKILNYYKEILAELELKKLLIKKKIVNNREQADYLLSKKNAIYQILEMIERRYDLSNDKEFLRDIDNQMEKIYKKERVIKIERERYQIYLRNNLGKKSLFSMYKEILEELEMKKFIIDNKIVQNREKLIILFSDKTMGSPGRRGLPLPLFYKISEQKLIMKDLIITLKYKEQIEKAYIYNGYLVLIYDFSTKSKLEIININNEKDRREIDIFKSEDNADSYINCEIVKFYADRFFLRSDAVGLVEVNMEKGSIEYKSPVFETYEIYKNCIFLALKSNMDSNEYLYTLRKISLLTGEENDLVKLKTKFNLEVNLDWLKGNNKLFFSLVPSKNFKTVKKGWGWEINGETGESREIFAKEAIIDIKIWRDKILLQCEAEKGKSKIILIDNKTGTKEDILIDGAIKGYLLRTEALVIEYEDNKKRNKMLILKIKDRNIISKAIKKKEGFKLVEAYGRNKLYFQVPSKKYYLFGFLVFAVLDLERYLYTDTGFLPNFSPPLLQKYSCILFCGSKKEKKIETQFFLSDSKLELRGCNKEVVEKNIEKLKSYKSRIKLGYIFNNYCMNLLRIDEYHPILKQILMSDKRRKDLIHYMCAHLTSDELEIFSELLSQLNEEVLEFLLKSFDIEINDFRLKRKISAILEIEDDKERKQAFKKYITDIYWVRLSLMQTKLSQDVISYITKYNSSGILYGWTNSAYKFDKEFDSEVKKSFKHGLIYKSDKPNVFNIIHRLKKKKKISNVLKELQEDKDNNEKRKKDSRKRKKREFLSEKRETKRRKIEKSAEQIIKEKIEEIETIQDIKNEEEWLKFLEKIDAIREYLEQETGWYIPYIEVIRAFPNLRNVFIKEKDELEDVKEDFDNGNIRPGKRKNRYFTEPKREKKRRKLEKNLEPKEKFIGGPLIRDYGDKIRFLTPPLLEYLGYKKWKIVRDIISQIGSVNKIMREIMLMKIFRDVGMKPVELRPDMYGKVMGSV